MHESDRAVETLLRVRAMDRCPPQRFQRCVPLRASERDPLPAPLRVPHRLPLRRVPLRHDVFLHVMTHFKTLRPSTFS